MEVVSYKCPNCAAPLEFDIDKQDWSCKFCGASFSENDLGKMEAQSDSETTDNWESSTDSYSEADAVSYVCPSCGGKVTTDKNTAATFCIYCHNPTVIASHLSGEYRPAKIIPFKLKKEEAVSALQKLCRKRPLLPPDFRDYAQKGEVGGLYVPFWLFGADVEAHLQATAKNISTWSDYNYRYTKTDTYYVRRDARLSFRGIPADGSSKMDDKLMESLEPFDYSQMADFSMEYLSGHFAESYDVDSNESSKRAFSRMRTGTEEVMRGLAQGYTTIQYNGINTANRNVDCVYAMLPVWTVMAKYKDKSYIFAMNGQTGKITGRLPLSISRLCAWFGGLAAALTAIFFLGAMLW